AVDDTAAALAFARSHSSSTGRAGAIGYCMGGKIAYELSRRYKPDAGVGYYGVGIEESLGDVRAPLMLHIAGRDAYCPPEAQQKIAATHPDAVCLYSNCDHAFARRGGAHYDASAAELADLRTVEFLLRHLVVKPHSLEAIWAEHIEHEFATRSTENTLATMV